jgi:hypothetical protein
MAIAGLALAIAGIAGAGTVVAAHETSSGAQQAASDTASAAVSSAQIQADAATKAAQMTSDTAANALAYSRSQSQLSLDQYNQQQQRLQPYRNLGSFALGQPPSAAPDALTLPNISTTGTTPTSGATTISTTGTTPTSGATTNGSPSTTTSGAVSANYQPLISALNAGTNPQSVISQFNTSQGLQTGSSYAWRAIPGAPGGGVVEVPGGAYLAPGPSGVWGYTPGSGGSSSGTNTAAASTTPQPVTLGYQPTYLSSGTPLPYNTLGQMGTM